MGEMREPAARRATAGSRPSAGMSRIRFKGQGDAPNLSPLQGPPRNGSRLGPAARFVNAGLAQASRACPRSQEPHRLATLPDVGSREAQSRGYGENGMRQGAADGAGDQELPHEDQAGMRGDLSTHRLGFPGKPGMQEAVPVEARDRQQVEHDGGALHEGGRRDRFP